MNTDRFKFRMWDNEFQIMQYDCWMDLSNGELRAFNGMPLMQCTGLRDKNGKLIYEDDICSYNFGMRTESEPDAGCERVIWDEKAGAWFFGDELLYDFEGLITIVGNIHEDLELKP
jgi:uncharacterized phage protein (TIGR01671 family)